MGHNMVTEQQRFIWMALSRMLLTIGTVRYKM
jgi:hypothetical protein